MDIGQASLDFLKQQTVRLGVSNIKTKQGDVTDLSHWPDASFDFVASYGVLHHTSNCVGGLREHFRVLNPTAYFGSTSTETAEFIGQSTIG